MASPRMLDAATVFLPQGIAHPVQPVLDAPMITPELEKLESIGLSARKTGDDVLLTGIGKCGTTTGAGFQSEQAPRFRKICKLVVCESFACRGDVQL